MYFQDCITGKFQGDLVVSNDETVHHATVMSEWLNESLVKIELISKNISFSFRALVVPSDEGDLLLIQEKTSNDFQLKGVKGFVKKFPNIHGGFIKRMNSFYFNVELNRFNQAHEQYYFIGALAD